MFTDIVILAGGHGVRLWPASKSDYPKQFISLDNGFSFLQLALLRACALDFSGHIIIVTRDDVVSLVLKQANMLFKKLGKAINQKLKEKLIIVPEPKSINITAPITVSCHLLNKIEPEIDHEILVLTSDHVIEPLENFVKDTEYAYKAANLGKIVCYSIQTTFPYTGYSYLKTGNMVEGLEDFENIREVIDFVEKPNINKAKEFFESELYTRNSGIFAFKSKVYLEELAKYNKESYHLFENLAHCKKIKFSKKKKIKVLSKWDGMEEVYSKAPCITIDTTIMKDTKKACTVLATFDWKDIGSWDTFESLVPQNQENVAKVECKNCFVYSDIPVALVGVEDLVVVVKNNKLLVMKKGNSDFLKDAVQQLEDE